MQGALIAQHPIDKHVEGTMLMAERLYPIPPTWIDTVLKSGTTPAVRIGTVDREARRLDPLPTGRADIVAEALLDRYEAHIIKHGGTETRIVDASNVKHLLGDRGYTQAPVLSINL